jgi:hypothetical protein
MRPPQDALWLRLRPVPQPAEQQAAARSLLATVMAGGWAELSCIYGCRPARQHAPTALLPTPALHACACTADVLGLSDRCQRPGRITSWLLIINRA